MTALIEKISKKTNEHLAALLDEAERDRVWLVLSQAEADILSLALLAGRGEEREGVATSKYQLFNRIAGYAIREKSNVVLVALTRKVLDQYNAGMPGRDLSQPAFQYQLEPEIALEDLSTNHSSTGNVKIDLTYNEEDLGIMHYGDDLKVGGKAILKIVNSMGGIRKIKDKQLSCVRVCLQPDKPPKIWETSKVWSADIFLTKFTNSELVKALGKVKPI